MKSIPDPPSRLIVDQNQTTSSTLFIAWQPGFDGGFQQTFNLEYCTNDTKPKEDECGVVTNLTKSSFRLNGLNPFTWYRLTLWAENSAGNSSTVTIVASTAPIPDPPSRLIVDQNQTTSSTLFIAWQPGFDGGFQQTFNLEYCTNDTKPKEDECGVVTNLTKSSFRLNGLNPFTWYRLTLWAENSAGNSSTVTIVASTAPLQPENYGVSVTRVKEGKVLKISKENKSEEVCFVLKTSQESCPLVNESKCIGNETEIIIDPEDDVVVVTYGRGLCSEPADIKDQPGQKVPSNNRGTPYIIIAIGVIASIGVIILISLGLMYFYGLMCCTKRKNANRNATQHQDSMEGQAIYTELAKDRPSHSSGQGTSDYMDLKPTNPTSTAEATSEGWMQTVKTDTGQTMTT
nr:synaptogenesis protein syg-2-like [Lytechinus pictus]